MIIIIEGPDGAGKSTLAKQLAEQTGYKLKHCKYNDGTDFEYILNYCTDIILDRSWYSEMVYGPIMRGKSITSGNYLNYLEDKLVKIGCIIIHATADIDTLWKNCIERGEDYVTTKDTLDLIRQSYIDLFSKPRKVPVVTYEIKDM